MSKGLFYPIDFGDKEKKIVDTNNKNIDRLIAILIGQTRTIGKLYGIIVTESVRRGIINQNELDQVFGSGIKKAMADLKVGEKDYEWFF